MFAVGVKCIEMPAPPIGQSASTATAQIEIRMELKMTTPPDRAAHLELVARLKSSYPELPDAPTPDLIDHQRFTAYTKTPHDVGGEPDAPMEFAKKQYEMWEENTYVMCEVLGWRGIWLSEERRRWATSPWAAPFSSGRPTSGGGSWPWA